LTEYDERVLHVEFTIEPFVEGQPGPHVLAAVAAVKAHGINVEFGPFATEFDADEVTVANAVSDLVREAYAKGATHVTLHMEKILP
jgi:uncharacterized protein YqgV (UPF0045/DUF77 family)